MLRFLVRLTAFMLKLAKHHKGVGNMAEENQKPKLLDSERFKAKFIAALEHLEKARDDPYTYLSDYELRFIKDMRTKLEEREAPYYSEWSPNAKQWNYLNDLKDRIQL
jgi:hypothetical protein